MALTDGIIAGSEYDRDESVIECRSITDEERAKCSLHIYWKLFLVFIT